MMTANSVKANVRQLFPEFIKQEAEMLPQTCCLTCALTASLHYCLPQRSIQRFSLYKLCTVLKFGWMGVEEHGARVRPKGVCLHILKTCPHIPEVTVIAGALQRSMAGYNSWLHKSARDGGP